MAYTNKYNKEDNIMIYRISYTYHSEKESYMKVLHRFASMINSIFANDIDPIKITRKTKDAVRKEILGQIDTNLFNGNMMRIANGSTFINLADTPQLSCCNFGIVCPIIRFEIKHDNSLITIGIMVEYNKSSRKSNISTYIFDSDLNIPDDIKKLEDISNYYIENSKKDIDCINPIVDLFIKNQCYLSNVVFNSIEDD